MDASQIDALVQRLVENPHDEEALAYAHDSGGADPKAYALMLEKVGSLTSDPSYASHWLSEAANVWLQTLGDAHRAAHVLMAAVDRDPTQSVAAETLAQLYRDKGNVRGLVALLERRAKALAPLTGYHPEIVPELAQMHEELGRLWSEAPLSQPKKAFESFRKAIELDPTNAYAIYAGRELCKSQGQWDEAYPLYEMELSLVDDNERRVALLRDEAQTRQKAGDLAGASRALSRARSFDEDDPALSQEFASSVVERIHAGDPVTSHERLIAGELLVGLAETYDGEHGLAYAGGALDVDPGHDQALQLYAYHAQATGRGEDLGVRYQAYLAANPDGAMAESARAALASIKSEAPPHLSSGGDANATGPQHSDDTTARPKLPPPPTDALHGALMAAKALVESGKKPEALAKYKEVLAVDPAHSEALAWVEDYLRTQRDYAQLRDVLFSSVRALGSSLPEVLENRKARLREVAGLCEGNLRDVDGAVSAYRQLLAIDRTDENARQSLMRLLERTQRWDDMATVLEQEAGAAREVAEKIVLEKRLASLHEQKRQDPASAAEAWTRIARLSPGDDRAIFAAVKLFEKAERVDAATVVITENARAVQDPNVRGTLFEKLGELRDQLGHAFGAGEAYANAAELQRSARLWELSEKAFASVEQWSFAANAAEQRALLSTDGKASAAHLARAAGLSARGQDRPAALARYEHATELDPASDDYASALSEIYVSDEHWDKLAAFLAKRGGRVASKSKRVSLRRQAASLYASRLSDKEQSREQWLKVLEDGEDREALEKLIDFAIEREDHTEAATLLRRLGGIAIDRDDKTRVALREAELLADGVGDIDTALVRYEAILSELDSTCRPALQAIADLQETRDDFASATNALERELLLVAGGDRGPIAARLARLYERLDDPKNAIRTLDIVRDVDPEDFDALSRLCALCERTENWPRVAQLLGQQIEAEADPAETSMMTKKLATLLVHKLDRGEQALAVLTELCDQGDEELRRTYVALGDHMGWKGAVAGKLVEWWLGARHGSERTGALKGAFERYLAIERHAEALRVGVELVRSKVADRDLAQQVEALAVAALDLESLGATHEFLARDLTGLDRATELVRQAEMLVRAGVPYGEAIPIAEPGMVDLPLEEAAPLVERLGALPDKADDVIEVYERQVSRARAPADRVRWLARAAQVAAEKRQAPRAQSFLELALSGIPSADTLSIVQEFAVAGDEANGTEHLRRALVQALSHAGAGARDGGRTRASLLRRAAEIARTTLGDIELSFSLLGDALITQVDDVTLDMVETIGRELENPSRSEAVFTRALSEVFDGPLVRQLLARRARLRRDELGDPLGAAADLKKLHELSPHDRPVLEQLSMLLRQLGDYRTLVSVYEDLILRGKDMNARSELARRVARMWEEQLADPREAADAWRRVLRLKPGDPEATEGLERTKSNMLKKPDADSDYDPYLPPRQDSIAPPTAIPPTRASVGAPDKIVESQIADSFDFDADRPGDEVAPLPEPADATVPDKRPRSRVPSSETPLTTTRESPLTLNNAEVDTSPYPHMMNDELAAIAAVAGERALERTRATSSVSVVSSREIVELSSDHLAEGSTEYDFLEATLARPYRPESGEVEIPVDEDHPDDEVISVDDLEDVSDHSSSS